MDSAAQAESKCPPLFICFYIVPVALPRQVKSECQVDSMEVSLRLFVDVMKCGFGQFTSESA